MKEKEDGKGGGGKHRTSPEDKALYKARGVPGYCVTPEDGKFRKGDGRKRGGPRKAKTVKPTSTARENTSDYLLEMFQRAQNEPVTMRDRVTGKTQTAPAIEVAFKRLMRNAIDGDTAAMKLVQANAEKAAKAQDEVYSAATNKVIQFVIDTHAGRRWKLDDFTRELLMDSVDFVGSPELTLMFYNALSAHNHAEDPGLADRMAARRAHAAAAERAKAHAAAERSPAANENLIEDAGLEDADADQDRAYPEASPAPRAPAESLLEAPPPEPPPPEPPPPERAAPRPNAQPLRKTGNPPPAPPNAGAPKFSRERVERILDESRRRRLARDRR